MNTVWKDKGRVIGKSGDLPVTRRNERCFAQRRFNAHYLIVSEIMLER